MVGVFVGLVGSWYSTWFSTLCQRGFPFHCFPLAGSAPSPFCCLPFAGAAPFRLQFAGLLLRWCLVVRLEGCLLRHLVFCHVQCSSSGACSFPSCRLLRGFQVTGCLSFCFPGDVGWASALPFFSVLLLLRLACRG